ncbi:serine--tRNA ligase [Muribaculum intestinale]|mgnify:FL=1|jgi:seryl-tRNA synthetase|uniref:Serine--tRNA ligase n=7 Tax=Muribaculum intestinale TaxID=1796646 RepID=A0A4S1ZTS3_9BACT|nr:serine--tRNA ligase [Muribaculum intestinale]MYM12530.1 serine--tRNA ligase [Muribaculum intestinale]ROS82369.1 serine--tRNA ligase [Muribaculaceae bacterium Isolate-042 (Harlan)]TGX87717.1 serine--tRNA ligase [Muribaculum intestinale]TGY74296.1 serine--tRNA ligase [Muribaculum intestinale]
MLTIQQIKEAPERIIARLAVKGFDGTAAINEILELDTMRRQSQLSNDTKAAELNRLAASIGQLMKAGKKDEAEEAKKAVAVLKDEQKAIADELARTETRIRDILLTVPNVPCDMVPEGMTADDNVVEATGGVIPELPADAMPHWDLAKKYNIIDFDLGVKITGAGFPVYLGKGARLQRALIQFFLDEAGKAGYLEVEPPFVVNEASGYGTGQLPDKEGQMYYVNEDNLYLIPTAEVPVTNLYRDVILPADKLPVKNCAFSACWRREAGSYGKDVRGLNRLHQFDKVEIVRIEKPEDSYAALEEMKAHVQGLLEKLGLPWHILRLCGGDMSFTSAITFDFEVYSAAQKRWLEVSSVSNFETYQANRLKCRYRGDDKKTRLCHTLNGSALALPRIMAALLENNQTPEGIIVPECLRKYTGFDIID